MNPEKKIETFKNKFTADFFTVSYSGCRKRELFCTLVPVSITKLLSEHFIIKVPTGQDKEKVTEVRRTKKNIGFIKPNEQSLMPIFQLITPQINCFRGYCCVKLQKLFLA